MAPHMDDRPRCHDVTVRHRSKPSAQTPGYDQGVSGRPESLIGGNSTNGEKGASRALRSRMRIAAAKRSAPITDTSITPTRRQLLTTAVIAGAASVLPSASRATPPAGSNIRPFHINVPQAQIDDLRRRLAAVRWPDKEIVSNQSQGVQLAKLEPLVRYWATDYNWRKAEAKLNALPQFITEIDGLDIQFAHIRSRHANAMPLIMAHGWPGSIFELLKRVGPLTDPTAHGGPAEDAFHLVLPTYPGYGFSGKPTNGDWAPPHVARAWHELMRRLGYTHYVAQGGLFSRGIRAAFKSLR